MSALGQCRLLAVLQAAALAILAITVAAEAQPAPRQGDPGVDPLTPRLELMLRAMRVARDWHIGRPGKPELIAGAIEGMLARLDPEAEFYSQAELRRIPRFAPSGGAGIGIELRREPAGAREERRGYRVISVRDASPSAVAGIKAGDLITRVDGRPAGNIPHLGMMHLAVGGAEGTTVRLTVERSGEDAPSDVDLRRTIEPPPAVSVGVVAAGVARIRLTAVDLEAAASLPKLVAALDATERGRMRGFVIDLRSTASGNVDGIRAIADQFLDTGPTVRTLARARVGRTDVASQGDIADGRPLIVLVDAGTAGPAEALAASLVGNDRARLAGIKTAGRGALRSLVALGARGEKGALRMTTERFLTPDGAPIEGKGLTPQVLAQQSPPSPRCRSLDIADDQAPESCRPRKVEEDGQLSRAIGLIFDDGIVAARGAPTTPKP